MARKPSRRDATPGPEAQAAAEHITGILQEAMAGSGLPPAPSGPAEHGLRLVRLTLAFYQWSAMTGRPPVPGDYGEAPGDWPDDAEVLDVFGNWESYMAACGAEDLPGLQVAAAAAGAVVAATEGAASRQAEIDKERKRLERQAAQLEKAKAREERKRADLAAQAQAARQDAQAQRDEARRRAGERDELAGQLRDAVARGEELAAELLELRSSARGADGFRVSLALAPGAWEAAWDAVCRAACPDGPPPEMRSPAEGRAPVPSGGAGAAAGMTRRGGAERLEAWWAVPDGAASAAVQHGGGSQEWIVLRCSRPDGAGVTPVAERLWRKGLVADGAAALPPAPERAEGKAAGAAVAALIASAGRTLPLVAVAGGCQAQIGQVMAAVKGRARVIVLDDQGAWGLTEAVGKRWSVFGTGLRAYWPGADPAGPDDSPERHPLMLHTPAGAGDVSQAMSLLGRELSGWWASAALPSDEPLAAGPAASRAEEEMWARLQDEITRREAAEAQAAQLRHRAAQLEAALAAGQDSPGIPDGQEDAPPATVADAVIQAQARCRHLAFSPDALASAQRSPFRRPEQVLEQLLALDELAGRWAQGGMGASQAQAATEAGLRNWKANVSPTARNRHDAWYHAAYEGEDYQLGPHFGGGANGGAQDVWRCYVHLGDGSRPLGRRILVGKVGRHGPDAATKPM